MKRYARVKEINGEADPLFQEGRLFEVENVRGESRGILTAFNLSNHVVSVSGEKKNCLLHGCAYLKWGHWELMPEGFTPDSEEKVY